MQNILEGKKNICRNSTHESCVFLHFLWCLFLKQPPILKHITKKRQQIYSCSIFTNSRHLSVNLGSFCQTQQQQQRPCRCSTSSGEQRANQNSGQQCSLVMEEKTMKNMALITHSLNYSTKREGQTFYTLLTTGKLLL